MKKLNGTVTLSILDEDNSQRVIFRIIPLCTKEGLIFEKRKESYPDTGSLRIIPDKREQSSFKERMREMGRLCCVQLYTEGKELTKVRQNRNYDPNQGECNQYAIYSDVICGFDTDAVFEVYQEEQDHSQALTENVLIQRGMMLYGPVIRGETVSTDELKPFGNENYLLHTVEDLDGGQRTYCWNPEAVITWRQRKKAMKQNNETVKNNAAAVVEQTIYNTTDTKITYNTDITQEPEEQAEAAVPAEQIPIGTKLEILDKQRTNEEHITELNVPVSDLANRLNRDDKPQQPETHQEPTYFHGTPIVEMPQNGTYEKQKESTMYNVVEKQLKEKHSSQLTIKREHRHVQNPIENLKTALKEAWQIPCLHPELVRALGENAELMHQLVQSPLMERQAKTAFTAAKAEMDSIEAERIALLVELDKVRANYQQTKDKMMAELTKQKLDEIASMDMRLHALKAEKDELEETLSILGNKLQENAQELLINKEAMSITSNGSDLTISPTVGYNFEPSEIVEFIRAAMNAQGFMCRQDCITEFLIFLSLYDEIAVMSGTLWEAELYVKSIIRALGLLNVSAWPSVFGNLHLVSLLPENELRTPTIEVIKNNRTPVKAYGHKTIRLIDGSQAREASIIPVVHVPMLNKERAQEKLNENGRPISLQTLHSFCKNAVPLYKEGEEWFDQLKDNLQADDLQVPEEILHAMRVFARIASPQLVGGFMEAADAAVLSWIAPMVMHNTGLISEHTMKQIRDLPRSLHAIY